MRGLIARVRAMWRVLSHSHQLEREMQDEMRFHVEMEAERLVRERGLDPQEARRQAHVRFGGVEKYKEAGRGARGRQWLDAISLDTRLGVRMLVKHRGLTLAGGFAMAVAIAIGATFFEVIGEMLTPALPFADGDRVVAVEFTTAHAGSPERRGLRDFAAWREAVKTIEHLGAFRTTQHNLVSATVAPEPAKVAEMTAAGFAIGRTPALLGRYLLPGDDPVGASPVVVISYQAWQSRFGAAPQIVGRPINLGGVPRTIVGVMPVQAGVGSVAGRRCGRLELAEVGARKRALRRPRVLEPEVSRRLQKCAGLRSRDISLLLSTGVAPAREIEHVLLGVLEQRVETVRFTRAIGQTNAAAHQTLEVVRLLRL